MIAALRSKISVLLLVVYSFTSCNAQETPLKINPRSPKSSTEVVIHVCDSKRTDDSEIHILYVGNSLTYSNDLPALVSSVGSSKGKSIFYETLTFPNYALEDHWIEGKMQKLICEGNFDFVVVQQGPSSQSDGRVMLLDYGRRIKDICTSRGTELAFFMVWPAKSYFHTFDGVIKNHTDAAQETNSLLCAVGTEFKMLGDRGDFRFYSADNFHPSVEGSQMAAEIIYSTLIK